jgi:hypothetical protein
LPSGSSMDLLYRERTLLTNSAFFGIFMPELKAFRFVFPDRLNPGPVRTPGRSERAELSWNGHFS